MHEELTQKPPMHLPWVDLIRVIAIYLVVVVHVSGQLTNIWGEIPNSQWLIADIYGGSRVSQCHYSL